MNRNCFMPPASKLLDSSPVPSIPSNFRKNTLISVQFQPQFDIVYYPVAKL